MLEPRRLNADDYDNILSKWWIDHGWETPPAKDFLPDNGAGGMIVFDDDIPVCAGFIYTTNSATGWIEWIISNKDYRKKPQRLEAIQMLIKILTIECYRIGIKYMYANNNNKYLVEHFKNQGFTVGCQNSTELIKRWD